GFGQVAYPGAKKAYGALLFNDRYCWFLDEAACPAPTRMPNGKIVSNSRSVRLVSLHEAGHVLGFGHFTVPSIMGMAGGSERYELTAYDREAARRLYERVDASVPFQ
ncbi:MAG: matrixin family metalloprotease, partial [Elusimicrobia bacterium]|nr:matrixin family metalloprotease [Elusimicrobiota bacterium]